MVTGRILLPFLGLLETFIFSLGCALYSHPCPHFSAQVRWFWVSQVSSLGLAFCLCRMGMVEFCLDAFAVMTGPAKFPS